MCVFVYLRFLEGETRRRKKAASLEKLQLIKIHLTHLAVLFLRVNEQISIQI